MASTFAYPYPRTTVVPAKTLALIAFSTGADSPVNRDSLTSKLDDEIRIASAAIRSPSLMMRISSLTTSLPGMRDFTPFLKTRALGLESSLSASSARSAFVS